MAERIRLIQAGDNTYRALRLSAELNDGATAQQLVDRKRVARVMREHGLAGDSKAAGSAPRSLNPQTRPGSPYW